MNKICYLAASILLLLFVQCQKESADSSTQNTEKTTPDNALVHYLENSDETYDWQLEDSVAVNNSTIYQVKLTSQTWRDLIWEHSLSIVVPNEVDYNGALLFISGGNNRNDDLHPGNNDEALQAVAAIARQNKAVTALIKQVPNQPLFGGKTEDEIISYTFHNYQEDGDYTWPLLFPMVKSVIKGMVTVQSFIGEKKGVVIENFMLTG
jgi:PhoPQ-activated pathogenicity-related protein